MSACLCLRACGCLYNVYLCLYVFGMCLAHCISLERLLFLMRRCPFGNNDGDDDHDDDSVLDDDDEDDISLE